jgi:hypothetical protein
VPLAGAGVAGKDVQNQLRAVQYAAGQRSLEVAQLGGRQIVVKEHQLGPCGGDHPGNLFHFARADQRGRVRPAAALDDLGSHLAAGAGDQFAKLGKRLFQIEAWRRTRPRPGSRA